MKKCARCKIIFHSDERTRCLYCSQLLMTAKEGDKGIPTQAMDAGDSPIRQIAREKKNVVLAGTQYLMGSYFKARTLNFMYKFYRNECKMGSEFKRFLIQPVNFSSLLIIPWVFLDFIDSLFFRVLYTNHCEDCNWKYTGAKKAQFGHDPEECRYNKEYNFIMRDIVSGDITRSEKVYQQKAAELVEAGKRSAYYDLVRIKTNHQALVDVLCIWISTGLLIGMIVWITFPFLLTYVRNLE